MVRLYGKKPCQFLEHFRVHPALDLLPAPFHTNEACSTEFLDMVGHRGGHDPQVPAQVPNIGTFFPIDAVNRPRNAAGDETQKDPQTVGV